MLDREPPTIPFSTEALQASSTATAKRMGNSTSQPRPECNLWISGGGLRTGHVVGEGGQGSQTCSSGVAPARAQFDQGARTVRRSDPLHG